MAPGDITITFNPLLGIAAVVLFLGLAVMMAYVRKILIWLGDTVTSHTRLSRPILFAFGMLFAVLSPAALWTNGWPLATLLGIIALALTGMADSPISRQPERAWTNRDR